MSIKSKIEKHSLCPFKRVFIRQHRRATQDAMQEVYKDKLGGVRRRKLHGLQERPLPAAGKIERAVI